MTKDHIEKLNELMMLDDYPDWAIELGLDLYANKDRGSYADYERYSVHAQVAFPKALKEIKRLRKELCHVCKEPHGQLCSWCA